MHSSLPRYLICYLPNPWKKGSRLSTPLVHSGSSQPSSKLKLPASNSSRTVELSPEYAVETLITEAMRRPW